MKRDVRGCRRNATARHRRAVMHLDMHSHGGETWTIRAAIGLADSARAQSAKAFQLVGGEWLSSKTAIAASTVHQSLAKLSFSLSGSSWADGLDTAGKDGGAGPGRALRVCSSQRPVPMIVISVVACKRRAWGCSPMFLNLSNSLLQRGRQGASAVHCHVPSFFIPHHFRLVGDVWTSRRAARRAWKVATSS